MKISIGQYIPGNSIFHKMNPLIKLLTNIIFIVLIFLSKSFIVLGIILLITIAMFMHAGLRKKQLIKIFYTTLIIGIFLLIFNMFLLKQGYSGQSAYNGGSRVDYNKDGNGFFFDNVTWWKINITDRGVLQTAFIMARIYIMIALTTILTATTKPTALTKGIEILIYPLKIFFIPTHIIAMIISIALRFIPTLLEEAQRIMKAQASRGVDFKNGNLKTKSKAMVTLIIPLFVSAFSKAEDLGNAMEARGYDPYAKRTKYRTYPIGIVGILFGLFVLGFTTFVILTKTTVIPKPFWWL